MPPVPFFAPLATPLRSGRAPYSVSFDTTTLLDGGHTVTSYAAEGNQTQSASVQFVIGNSVVMTVPSNGLIEVWRIHHNTAAQ